MTSMLLRKPEQCSLPSQRHWIAVAGLLLFSGGCGKPSPVTTPAAKPQVSQLSGSATADATVIATPAAEFALSPAGYLAARLLSGNQKLSLDDPPGDPGIQVIPGGSLISPFTFDVGHPQISEPHGRLGTKGKRVEVSGKSSAGNVQETLVVEVYDDFPNVALMSASVKN